MNSKLKRFSEQFNDSEIYNKAQDIRLSDIEMYLRQVENNLRVKDCEFLSEEDLGAVQRLEKLFPQYAKFASEFYAFAIMCRANADLFNAFDSESDPFIQRD